MKRLLPLIFLVLIFACTPFEKIEDDNNKTKQEICLELSSINFSGEAEQREVTFTSTSEWTAQVINTRASEWCEVTPLSGSAGSCVISIQVKENKTSYDRHASIIIKSKNQSAILKVSQKQKASLTVTSSRFEIEAEGGNINIEVKSNIDYNYRIDGNARDWIFPNDDTQAATSSNLSFTISKNNDANKREGKIYIEGTGITEVVSIYQSGCNPSIILTKNEYIVSSSGESIAIEISSNVDVEIVIPEDVGWIKENTTKVMSTCTYHLDIFPNETYEQRSAVIAFTNKENGLSEGITITQNQKDVIVVARDNYEYNCEGGDLLLKVQTSSLISVTISDNAKDWIYAPHTRSLEIKSLYFHIAENSGSTKRVGEIILSSERTTQKITITQHPTSIAGIKLTYTSSDGNVVIPNESSMFGARILSNIYKDGVGTITFDNYISTIGESAFENCTNLLHIELPEGITSIGDYAFAGCSNLEYMSLPATVVSIGNYAFKECTGEIIINCDIPDAEIVNNTPIGCFEGAAFNKVSVTDWVREIGNYAFSNCDALQQISVANSVCKIGDSAFRGCSTLTQIKIPEGITAIGSSTFLDCTNIKKIELPGSIISIGDHAFYNCTSLTDINIPSGVTHIGEYSFYDCANIRQITLPSSINSFGTYAFYGCGGELFVRCNIPNCSKYETIFGDSKFTKLTVEEGVTSLGDYAFNRCNDVRSVKLPKSLKHIGNYAFVGCKGELTVGCNIPSSGLDGVFCSTDFSKVVIEDGVTRIGENAFLYNINLKTVEGAENVQIVDEDAFCYCSSLTSINLPNVHTIGAGAFAKCVNLTYINFPNIRRIGDWAFELCSSLKYIELSEDVEFIDWCAFADCTGEIVINCNIDDCALRWGAFSKVVIGPSVKHIGESAFKGCKGELFIHCDTEDSELSLFDGAEFTTATFGEEVNRIGENLFFNNDSLRTVTIGPNVKAIGLNAFYDCSNLHSVYSKADTPPILADKKVFNYNASKRNFYVPRPALIYYKSDEKWMAYFDKIEGYDFVRPDGSGSLENPNDSGNDHEW